MPDEERMPSYRPGVFYFRQAIRRTDDPEELRGLAMLLCRAIELEREWIRAQGMIPPKQVMLEEEIQDKGWKFDDGQQELRLL